MSESILAQSGSSPEAKPLAQQLCRKICPPRESLSASGVDVLSKPDADIPPAPNLALEVASRRPPNLVNVITWLVANLKWQCLRRIYLHELRLVIHLGCKLVTCCGRRVEGRAVSAEFIGVLTGSDLRGIRLLTTACETSLIEGLIWRFSEGFSLSTVSFGNSALLHVLHVGCSSDCESSNSSLASHCSRIGITTLLLRQAVVPGQKGKTWC